MRDRLSLVRAAAVLVLLTLVVAGRAAGQGVDPGIREPDTALVAAVEYRIESVPFGAEVRYVTPAGVAWRVGVTPLDVRVAAPLDGVFVVALGGYGEARVVPGRLARNVHRVTLVAEAGRSPAPLAVRVRPRPSRWWLDAAALGLAVGATVVAIDQKTRADDLFEVYRETGDATLRPSMRRYDTRAGVALGIGSAGLGVFAVRLVRRR